MIQKEKDESENSVVAERENYKLKIEQLQVN